VLSDLRKSPAELLSEQRCPSEQLQAQKHPVREQEQEWEPELLRSEQEQEYSRCSV
jgi:hypothetical protein